MASIKVDYAKVRADARFRALTRKLACEGKAWEMCLRFWTLAQKYWGQHSLVPRKLFDLEDDLAVLLEVDLAVEREDGIYARGAELEFDWYQKKCDASKKGVERRRKEPIGSPIDKPLGRPIGQPSLVNPSATATATATVIDKELSDDNSMSPDRRRRGPDPLPLVRLWNEQAHPNLPRVDESDFKASQPRYRAAKARLVEKPDLAYWASVIERMSQSSFCRGEIEPKDGRKPWRGNFEFMVRPESARKVLSGAYDDPDLPRHSKDEWEKYLSPEMKVKLGIA